MPGHVLRRSSVAAVGIFLTALVAMSLPIGAQQSPTSVLPPGDGRDIVAVSCTQCHSAAGFTALRQGRAAWKHQVYDMIERGAQVSPDEIETVVAYLARNFGPGVPISGPAPVPVTLAAGPGSELVASRCAICHGVDRVVSANRPRTQWSVIVRRMEFLGSNLSATQRDAIIAYLAINYGAPQAGLRK